MIILSRGEIMKKTVLVIFGGKSSEYSVALHSAAYVIDNIDRHDYDVLTMGVTDSGNWLYCTCPTSKIADGSWVDTDCSRAMISPAPNGHYLLVESDEELMRIPFDVVFPVMHGRNGEDGTIQGFLTMAGIPFVGCGMTSSALCMDKAFTNLIARANGVNEADWLVFKKGEYEKDPENCVKRVTEELKYPVFVKPAIGGSSVGISKVADGSGLAAAFENAFAEDGKVVVETGINAREVECAVLGGAVPRASGVGEIVAADEFYDYNSKYVADSKLSIPADIGEEHTQEIRALALKLFDALDCEGMARVDFFIGKDDGKVYFNEINTIPGFTSISMYPKLFAKTGMSGQELIGSLIRTAFRRSNER